MLENNEDSELIRRYLTKKDEKAIEVLVRRYYNVMYRRFLKYSKNQDDAHDLSQQLWMKIIKGLKNYNESGKFMNYLNTAATNLLKNHWNSKNRLEQDLNDEIKVLASHEDTLKQTELNQALVLLTRELIPNLSSELRLIYLLKHESEYWEDKHPLRWHHLAELNGANVKKVGELFEQARNKLVSNTNNPMNLDELTNDEKLIFLIWTQAQRQNKNKRYTEQYFAKLLDIPVNTFKTRYRAALKQLREGLDQWQ